MKKLSIIIPVYNVEKYIKKCLVSCIKQNIPSSDYEIIVVNDGTTDKSLEIIENISKDIDNIRVITKENGGLSSARNTGLKAAKGEFVWFVDSDDWIEENCLNYIIQELNNIEILVLDGFFAESNDKVVESRKHNLKTNIFYSGGDIYNSGYYYPYSGAPYYIYNRDFLLNNNLYFKEGIYYEDVLFTPKLLSIASKCKYYNTPVYYYLIRSGSITNSNITIKNCSDLLIVSDELIKFLSIDHKYINEKVIYDSVARVAAVFYRYRWIKLNRVDKKIMVEKFKKRKYWIRSILKSRNFKYLIYYFLIR